MSYPPPSAKLDLLSDGLDGGPPVQFVVGDGIRPEDVEQSSLASILSHISSLHIIYGHESDLVSNFCDSHAQN